MRFMRRAWVKLWVNEWLDGITRYQMSGAQRAFRVDLLAMAGRSRYPGIICSGMDGNRHVGYPLKVFAALDAGAEIDVLETLELFEKTKKIVVEITGEEPIRLYKLTICNWDRYQSEYQRQKGYRGSNNRKRSEVTANVTTESKTRYPPEVEGKLESESEGEERQKNHPSPAAITDSFSALGHKPFGPKAFQESWAQEWSAAGENPNWTDLMEETIQQCRSLGVKVPSLFFKHKHEIESGEVRMRYKVTPL